MCRAVSFAKISLVRLFLEEMGKSTLTCTLQCSNHLNAKNNNVIHLRGLRSEQTSHFMLYKRLNRWLSPDYSICTDCMYFWFAANAGIMQIRLLWRRAVCDPDSRRIFCLVCEHNMSYKLAKEAVQDLRELMQGKRGTNIIATS